MGFFVFISERVLSQVKRIRLNENHTHYIVH